MTTETEEEKFVEIALTPDQAQWFIERLQEALDQSRQENEMLKNQIGRHKEVKL